MSSLYFSKRVCSGATTLENRITATAYLRAIRKPCRAGLFGFAVYCSIGFNLLPDEAAEKIKQIEELLKANGRKRSDVKLAVSPYTKPIKTDDLKRYCDAGVEEIALLASGRPRTERDLIAGLEQMAREFVEPAARL